MVIKQNEIHSNSLAMTMLEHQRQVPQQQQIEHSTVPVNRRDSISLSDYYSDNEPNDLRYIEVSKIAQYREAIEIIQRKCEALSRDNERLVRRLHCVKKVTKQKERDVSLLKTRLDVYNDEWRTAQPEPDTRGFYQSTVATQAKTKKSKIRNKNAANATDDPPKTTNSKGTVKGSGKRKRPKGEKQERDPNAPKRPANPFFQFCQEQRQLITESDNTGQPELTKQELTKQLANQWRTMNNESKQIYINRYESSKQKYNQEMDIYKKNNEKQQLL